MVNTENNGQESSQANSQRQYFVTKQDLPVHCPMNESSLWNSHPKVFISMESGKGSCPYCGAEYILK